MSSVTLYISGHGMERLGEQPGNMDNVTLLSFCGLVGTYGKMPQCYDNRNRKVPIDIITLNDKLRPIYKKELAKKTRQIYIAESIREPLRTFYEKNCGVTFSHAGGFTMTEPRNERWFQLRPGSHENCILSCTKRDEPKCIQETDPMKQYCPEYGIVVIASNNERDDGYTLVTTAGTQNSNLSYPDVFEHWYDRAQGVIKQRIRQQMTGMEGRDKVITLTELVTFFRSMGFQNIIILDPTCRELKTHLPGVKQGLWQRTAEAIMEQNKHEKRQLEPKMVGIVEQAVDTKKKGILKNIDGKTMLCIGAVCLLVIVKNFLGGKHKRNKRCRTHKNCKTHKRR